MNRCKCGSFAINHNRHGRDGSDPDLCDVCYWRKRADDAETAPWRSLAHSICHDAGIPSGDIMWRLGQLQDIIIVRNLNSRGGEW